MNQLSSHFPSFNNDSDTESNPSTPHDTDTDDAHPHTDPEPDPHSDHESPLTPPHNSPIPTSSSSEFSDSHTNYLLELFHEPSPPKRKTTRRKKNKRRNQLIANAQAAGRSSPGPSRSTPKRGENIEFHRPPLPSKLKPKHMPQQLFDTVVHILRTQGAQLTPDAIHEMGLQQSAEYCQKNKGK